MGNLKQFLTIALLSAGSAIWLFSCDKAPANEDEPNDEGLMTEFNENLTLTESENGHKKHVFKAPLMEGYGQAKDPYQEFREGIELITFQQQDSMDVQATSLTADYAVNYTDRKLWEARGNVVIKKSNGEQVYTQQIFWNERTHRIWSNVDTRVVRADGSEQLMQWFETDEAFKDMNARRARGRMYIDVAPNREAADSTAVNPT